MTSEKVIESAGQTAQRLSLEIPVLLWHRVHVYHASATRPSATSGSFFSPVSCSAALSITVENPEVLGLCIDVRFDYSKMHVKAFGSPRLAVKSPNRFVYT